MPGRRCRNHFLPVGAQVLPDDHVVGSATPPLSPPLPSHLRVSGIVKRFGGVEALKGVDFDVCRGEVVALVGDNGAGKSTLMKTLAGAHRADEGQFFIEGAAVSIHTPNDATALGIQIVYQDLALCENLDVAANLFLGAEPTRFNLGWIPSFLRPIDDIRMEEHARKAIDQLQVRTLNSVRALVGGLSGGQRQAIAIARAVGVTESSVILLDEPTAALGVAQTRQVLDLVKRLRENNHAVVYISHNLRDIFEIADRITVLRHGENVRTYVTAETNPDEIVVAMTRGID